VVKKIERTKTLYANADSLDFPRKGSNQGNVQIIVDEDFN
jgi:hypothetical protein